MKNYWAQFLSRAIPPPDPAKPVKKPFGHLYPWQLDTRLNGLQLITRLEQRYSADELKNELDAILRNYAPQEQFGPYHLGGWEGVALVAIDGKPENDHDDFNLTLKKTPAFRYAPLMEEIVDALPGEKRRVRILQLEPGKRVFWHYDAWHSIDTKLLRLHVPIVTDERVGFQVSHEDCRWQPGELWYGDFSFPHRLQNGSDVSRVHLVIDIENNDELRKLFPQEIFRQRDLRERIRTRCRKSLKLWNQLFATERRLLAEQSRRATAG